METLTYTVQEAAKLLRLGRTNFYREVALGNINIYKIGRRSYVTRRELERYVSECERRGVVPSPRAKAHVPEVA